MFLGFRVARSDDEREAAVALARAECHITVPDEHPSPNAETALVPMEPIASQEDLQPTIKMAQLTPIQNRQATAEISAP